MEQNDPGTCHIAHICLDTNHDSRARSNMYGDSLIGTTGCENRRMVFALSVMYK